MSKLSESVSVRERVNEERLFKDVESVPAITPRFLGRSTLSKACFPNLGVEGSRFRLGDQGLSAQAF